MKRILVLSVVLFLVSFLLYSSEMTGADSLSGVEVRITEMIPSSATLAVEVPVYCTDNIDFLVGSHFRASSWYFDPTLFYEVGVSGLVRFEWAEGRFEFTTGLGTAFSRNEMAVSVPLRLPLEFCYTPVQYLSLGISIDSLLYGEGIIEEIVVAAGTQPFAFGLSASAGIHLAMGYSWTTKQFNYYLTGLMVEVGYEF